jgi:2-phosphosulfolactate phosphatase
MTKIHLLMRKEEINADKMKENKLAVVFDVLLATSTISAGLYFGAKEVIPVLNADEAREEALRYPKDRYVTVGEYEGKTIEGFLAPNPLQLKEKIGGKTVILSTTNGTVAIRKASEAKKVFVCSMLNVDAVASAILSQYNGETILIICSGSSGEFCLEDFYGAGLFLDRFLTISGNKWNLSDSAKAALYFYRGNFSNGSQLLTTSYVGQMLKKYGFEEEIEFVSQANLLPVVTYLRGRAVVKENNFDS